MRPGTSYEVLLCISRQAMSALSRESGHEYLRVEFRLLTLSGHLQKQRGEQEGTNRIFSTIACPHQWRANAKSTPFQPSVSNQALRRECRFARRFMRITLPSVRSVSRHANVRYRRVQVGRRDRLVYCRLEAQPTLRICTGLSHGEGRNVLLRKS